MGHANPLMSGGLLPGGHGVEGIRVPEGDPDALRRAATTWAHTGDAMRRDANAIARATLRAGRADWSGIAALEFFGAVRDLTLHIRRGARQCDSAAAACRQHAGALDDAQEQARRAITAALRARERIDEARRAIDQHTTAAENANATADEARAHAQIARGLPAGAGELDAQQAERREQRARSEADAAQANVRRAQERLTAAEEELDRARRRGKDAVHDAQVAGRRAAMALHSVAAGATPPPGFRPPVPAARSHGPFRPIVDLKGWDLTVFGVTTNLKPEMFSVLADVLDAARKGDPRAAAEAAPRGALKAAGEIASAALLPLNAYLTWEENRKKGMSSAENAYRTVNSTVAGTAAAIGGGLVCAPAGPVAAAACSVAGGYLGTKSGDLAAGLRWDLGTVAIDGIESLADEAADLVDRVNPFN